MTPEKEAQLLAEIAALQQRVAELEAEQQQREVELAHWLAAEREHWALADALNQTGAAISSTLRGEEVLDRVLDELTRVVACDAACILLIQADMARVYRWRGYVQAERASPKAIVSATFHIDRMPVLKAVRDTGRPLAVAQPAEQDAWVHKFGRVWVKSYACAPIRRRGKVVGFLTIDSETTHYIEPADADALQAFADQAALALENVGLHNQVREEIIRRVRTLKKERNFISTLLDTADALVVALDREGRIVHFNRACEQISGYSLAEVKNRYAWELLPPEAGDIVQHYFTTSSHKPSGDTSNRMQSKFEAHLVPKTGQQRLIAWSNATLLDKTDAVEYVIATGIDITEQRQAEAALRESEERFKKLFEFAPDAYYLNDLNGRIIDGNRAAEELIGYQKEAVIGKNLLELNLLSPQEIPKALAALTKGLQGDVTGPDEFILTRKDGSQVKVEIRTFPVEIGDQKVVLGIARDITEHKQIEEALRQQNEQLQARNQELDAYARTVAHDLKNPIGTLTTMAQVLAEAYSTMPPEELGEYLQSMARSSQKANRIVEGLLLLAGVRQRTVAIRSLNMANIVAETLASMADMIEAQQAEIITPSEWPTVLGYAPWLEEVWSNYISNGLKYGGQPPRLELGFKVQADGMARFWVKDNGPGLTAEAQAQLFTEFTQLEPDRLDSYGLGLSIVRRIVERLGGKWE
ncbi:MAG: PAS domain S-box protein [Anaerolineales bacterium]|nr:PAS domain S-box protein [Anaerolineales bacterium]